MKHKLATVAIWLNRNTGYILVAIVIFFGLSILKFQKDNKQLLEDTKRISKDTQIIVSKQDETLKAIQQLALDNKISGDELKETVLCMLVVPIKERNTDVQKSCRNQAIAKVNKSTPTPTQTKTQTQAPAPTPAAKPQNPPRTNSQQKSFNQRVNETLDFTIGNLKNLLRR